MDTGLHQCDCRPDHVDSAKHQAELQTGYSCGLGVDNCIQPDGSGYYTPSQAEVGGDEDHRFQGHNFHLIAGEFFAPDERNDAGRVADPNLPQPPQYSRSRDYRFNPNFLETNAPWGFRAGFQWLASAGRVRLTAEEERARQSRLRSAQG